MFKKRKVNKSNLRTKEDELDQSAASGQTEGGEAVVVNLVKGNVGTSARGLSFNANSSKTTLPVSATGAVNIESDRSAAAHVYAGDATHTIEIDTAIERDYRSTLERAQQMKQQVADAANDGNGNNNITSHGNGNNDNSKETGNGEKVYKGTNAYDTYTNKDVTTALSNNKATGTMGPLRAPAFLRATVAIDYQPNVCKDYKETGKYISSPLYLCCRNDGDDKRTNTTVFSSSLYSYIHIRLSPFSSFAIIISPLLDSYRYMWFW